MLTSDATNTAALSLAPVRSENLLGRPAPQMSTTPTAFAQALQDAQNTNTTNNSQPNPAPKIVTIGNGDTLIGVIRDQAEARGLKLTGSQEMRLARQVAEANRISNPDRIFIGQKIDLSSLERDLSGGPEGLTPMMGAALRATPAMQNLAIKPLPPSVVRLSSAHPVLEKTLDRAVAKGFIPPADKAAVFDKIVQMGTNHKFSPDDFARMTLMESDGMNPRASNQRCHGIIQFCDGPSRGAASAGFAANPKAILDLSVHKQLSLVDKYFDDVGLKNQGPAGLEDLYLSVLNPASRQERVADSPLNIQGNQARALHVGSDTSAPITRQSIRQGLLQNAAQRLGQMLPASMRVQAQKAQQYAENSNP